MDVATTMTKLPVSQIVFDAGTQVRAAINQRVVADYSEAMATGATFPPIVVFHDGNQYYLADGFHRLMAAQRIHRLDMLADVRPGTKEDALWFALGANSVNGQRLTLSDKRHAIQLAVQTWPEKSGAVIAEQVGCSPQYVSQIKSGMTTTCDRIVTRSGQVRMASPSAAEKARAEAMVLLKQGVPVSTIRKQLRIGRDTLLELRRSLGLGVDKSKEGVRQRRDQMRAMASEGYTSRQIAAKLGLSEEGCRGIMRDSKIDVPADRVMRSTHRHKPNRIVSRIVMDAENLTEGVNLIDFAKLDSSKLPEWLRSLSESRDKLSAFIRRLMKEQQNHGEAA